MQSSGHSSGDHEVHRGYDLEAGLLARAREWIDLVPALRLLRTLRIAGSPPLIILTALLFGLWLLGHHWLASPSDTGRGSSLPAGDQQASDAAFRSAAYLRTLIPTTLLEAGRLVPETAGGDRRGGWRSIATVLWALLIWTPTAMLLARQGALLTAHRSLSPLGPAIGLVVRRTPQGWIAAAVPLLCCLPLVAAMLLIGWGASWFEQSQSLQRIAAFGVVLLALPCGLLAVGAHVAIPLSWAAVINERDPDSLDALSRGYEYLWRRPIALLLYVVFSVGLLAVVGGLAAAVVDIAARMAATAMSLSGGPAELRSAIETTLWYLPVVVVLAQLGALVGGIYLLIRRDANHQEVEDLWQPPAIDPSGLPQLPL